MQKDMHFYGVYALALASGIKPETASIIAHSSQFVDDATIDEAIELSGNGSVLPTMTSHKPIDYQNTIPGDQWKVWVPFHFLPGNEGTTFHQKMICRKDSEPANLMKLHALKHKTETFGPHLIGITAHVYADTFAHYGFSGIGGAWNKIDNQSIRPSQKFLSTPIGAYLKTKFDLFKAKLAGTFAEAIPIGHGAVATYPDRPYLEWSYEYEDKDFWGGGHKVTRDNGKDFLEACEKLFGLLKDFLKDNDEHSDGDGKNWDDIKDVVENIVLTEGTMDQRIDLWRNALTSGSLANNQEVDKHLHYNEKKWSVGEIVMHYQNHNSVAQFDPCLFYIAAWKHRQYVLRELLPEVGILAI